MFGNDNNGKVGKKCVVLGRRILLVGVLNLFGDVCHCFVGFL